MKALYPLFRGIVNLFFLEGVEPEEGSWMLGLGGVFRIKLSYEARGYRVSDRFSHMDYHWWRSEKGMV